MRTRLTAGIGALALVGTGLAAAAPTAAAGAATGAGANACPPTDTPASARVAEGSEVRSEPASPSPQKVMKFEAALQDRLAKMGYDKASEPKLANGSVKIPVYAHVIRRKNGSGNTTNRSVRRQVRVLNRAFRGDTSGPAINTPFRFRLKNIDRTRKTDWFNWTFEDDDKPAKKALHQDNQFRSLDIYITKLAGGVLGYAFLPESVQDRPFRDGVVLHKASLPGGSFATYNRGDTGTHEVGHWLNLLHTFQGGCDDPGDMVEDTPRQNNGDNVFVCDETLNTCGNNTGLDAHYDPVHNFMNYTGDKCMDRFTFGQEDRMAMSYLAYRAG
ncbi:zinc metalloprotease [soil metagenome]